MVWSKISEFNIWACVLVCWASLVAQKYRTHLPMQEIQVRSLGQEDSLEKEMATHSFSCLRNLMDREAWRASLWGCKELDMI